MLLARIAGTVVATRKDPRLEGKKLLICQLVNPQGTDEKGYIIAVDTVNAGFREKVLIVQGSSARMASGCKDTPVDAAIVGIVDQVDQDGEKYDADAGTGCGEGGHAGRNISPERLRSVGSCDSFMCSAPSCPLYHFWSNDAPTDVAICARHGSDRRRRLRL